MANNYRQRSSLLPIKPTQIEQARLIVERVSMALEESEKGYCGVNVEIEKDGVWFYGEEFLEAENVVEIAQALLDELKIDEPFTFSWADTCSKMRIDEFGGGACSIKRGEAPFYVDAFDLAAAHFKAPA